MTDDPSPSPNPDTSPSMVKVQSLTPTSLTGGVPPPVARTASEAVPAPSASIDSGSEVVPAVVGGSRKKSVFLDYWHKVGGGSLTISLLVHAALIAVFVAIVTVTVQEPKVDFLPGGGSRRGEEASRELTHQVQQKKLTKLNKMTPMGKVVSQNLNAAIALPDVPVDVVDVPELAIPMSGMFASRGFGEGFGAGGMKGVAFKPVFMFGRELKDSRKIAVVMDVSRSMTRYLPAVAKELDKIAGQSVLVLYFGCGLTEPKKGEKIRGEVTRTDGKVFASFWQHWQGKTPLSLPADERKKLAYDPGLPMPLEDIYKKMAGRRNTYFVDFNGVQYAWTALMCKEVGDADTIYWFADFMDKVEEKKMEEVLKKLKDRRQKLVMHATARGRSFEKVRDGLALPLGGEVVEAKVEK